MAVTIRLSRIGKKHAPFYRIVAVDSRKKRDGAFLDNLGTYDGLKGTVVRLNLEGLKGWIAKGATLSDTVKRIYKTHKRTATVAQ